MNQHNRHQVEQENYVREAISRASGTLIRNVELLYSTAHPFDLARKTILDVLGDRGLTREVLTFLNSNNIRGGQ